jgi:alpha-amylase
MASPHTAGAVALYLEKNPLATPSQVVAALTTAATKDVIMDAGFESPNLLLHTNFATPSTWLRTVVFIEGQTQTGQDMFIRGGIDHTYARNNLGLDCAADKFKCAMPIRHLNFRNATTAPWKSNDNFLDWHGPEQFQSGAAQGSPLDWTINVWPSNWGTKRTVAIDGYGETPMNKWGAHYWMLEVEMDCSKTVNGWFELKSFISNGPGWENNVSQPGAPYSSGNHFAQCGKLSVFKRGQNNPVIITNL